MVQSSECPVLVLVASKLLCCFRVYYLSAFATRPRFEPHFDGKPNCAKQFHCELETVTCELETSSYAETQHELNRATRCQTAGIPILAGDVKPTKATPESVVHPGKKRGLLFWMEQSVFKRFYCDFELIGQLVRWCCVQPKVFSKPANMFKNGESS